MKPHVERPSGNDPERRNNWNKDPKHRNQVILVPIEDEGKLLKTSRNVTIGSGANRRVQMCDSRSSGNEPQSMNVEEVNALKSSQVPANHLGKNSSNGFVANKRCKFVIVGLLVMSCRAGRDL